MAMEKYGVDMSKMAPTDEQIKLLKEMGLHIPDSFKEAQEKLSESEIEKDGKERKV